MTNSEPNVTSASSDLVSRSGRDSSLLGFALADTLAAMSGVVPVCASLSLSSARRRSTTSVRVPVCLPRVLPPTPQPQLVSRPQTEQHGPQHAAGRSAARTCARRSALTRQRSRKFERTPNHALQRTGMAVTARAAHHLRPPPPSPAHGPRQPCPSLSLGSLGDSDALSTLLTSRTPKAMIHSCLRPLSRLHTRRSRFPKPTVRTWRKRFCRAWSLPTRALSRRGLPRWAAVWNASMRAQPKAGQQMRCSATFVRAFNSEAGHHRLRGRERTLGVRHLL